MNQVVFGLNLSHDRAACLMVGGAIRVAIAEERLSRKKHDMPLNEGGERFALVPERAIAYCLAAAGLTLGDVSLVVASTTYVENTRTGRRRALTVDDVARQLPGLEPSRIAVIGHHLAHALSAFCCSGFEDATVLVADGGGSICGYDADGTPTQFERTSLYAMTRDEARPLSSSVGSPPAYGNSVGDYYQVMTELLGFRKGDEGKAMAFASFGSRARVGDAVDTYGRILNAIVVAEDGAHAIDPACQYDDDGGLPQYLTKQFGPVRQAPDVTCARDVDIAFAFQLGLERAVVELARCARRLGSSKRLCYAGGVALNCVANGRLAAAGIFEEIFIQPAAGDDGTAIGGACWGWKQLHGRYPDARMSNAFLGKTYSQAETRAALERFGASAVEVPRAQLAERVVADVLAGKIVALFDGGSEFGPRALGHRSILCDARSAAVKEVLNGRVKHREAFRPFAAIVLREHAHEYFRDSIENPFMLMAFPMREPELLPGVCHVDGTSRIQTVGPEAPLLREILEHTQRATGVPVLLNTSFNDSEPIVETPDDALSCLFGTRIDVLYLQGARVEGQGDGRRTD